MNQSIRVAYPSGGFHPGSSQPPGALAQPQTWGAHESPLFPSPNLGDLAQVTYLFPGDQESILSPGFLPPLPRELFSAALCLGNGGPAFLSHFLPNQQKQTTGLTALLSGPEKPHID